MKRPNKKHPLEWNHIGAVGEIIVYSEAQDIYIDYLENKWEEESKIYEFIDKKQIDLKEIERLWIMNYLEKAVKERDKAKEPIYNVELPQTVDKEAARHLNKRIDEITVSLNKLRDTVNSDRVDLLIKINDLANE